jgi:hypothetical protein
METKRYKSCSTTLKNVFTKLSNYSSCQNLIPQEFYNKITEQDEPLCTEQKLPEKDLLTCDIYDNNILNDNDILNLRTPKECHDISFSGKTQFDDSFLRTQYDEGKVVSTKSSIDKITPITSRSSLKPTSRVRFDIPIPKPNMNSSFIANEPANKKTKTVPIPKYYVSKTRPVSKSKSIISEDNTIIKELQGIFGENLENFNEESILLLI